MYSTEEDNAAQLKIFSSNKSYHQYGQVIISIWLRIFSTGLSHSQHSLGCAVCSYVKSEYSGVTLSV